MKYCKFLFLLLFVTGLAWAANADIVSAERDHVLRQRVHERWDALMKKDYATAYQFEMPVFRSAYSLQEYQRGFGDDIVWEKVEVDRLLFQGDDVATIYLNMQYHPAKHVMEGVMPKITSMMTEKWILVDGQWWHVPEPR